MIFDNSRQQIIIPNISIDDVLIEYVHNSISWDYTSMNTCLENPYQSHLKHDLKINWSIE